MNFKKLFKNFSNQTAFQAITGNPPYQGLNSEQIFPYFQETALKITANTCLIYPARWWYGTTGLEKFRNKLIPQLEIIINLTEKLPFQNTEIAGGITITKTSANPKTITLTELNTNQTTTMNPAYLAKTITPLKMNYGVAKDLAVFCSRSL